MSRLRIVLNTNPLIAALMKDSTSRNIIKLAPFEFLFPKDALSEIEKYLPYISKKNGLNVDVNRIVLDTILTDVRLIDLKDYEDKLDIARSALAKIDTKDAVFVALCLSKDCLGIWSNDKHLKKQTLVKVFTSEDMCLFIESDNKK